MNADISLTFTNATVAQCNKATAVRVDELAAAMVDIAVNAGEKGMWENRDLVEKGREVLGEKR